MFYDFFGFQDGAGFVRFLISVIGSLVALLSLIHLRRASKVLGGIIGKAFNKMMIGIVLNILAVSFFGLTFEPLNQYDAIFVTIIGPTVWVFGNLSLLFGFKDILKISKS